MNCSEGYIYSVQTLLDPLRLTVHGPFRSSNYTSPRSRDPRPILARKLCTSLKSLAKVHSNEMLAALGLYVALRLNDFST